MSRKGSSGRGGSHGQVNKRGFGQGRGGGFSSGRGGGRGNNQNHRRNQVMRQGVTQGADVKTHSHQIEPTPYPQDIRNSVPRESTLEGAEKEIEMLISQADTIRTQLQTIYTRISVIQSERGANPTRTTDGNLRGKTMEAGGVVAIIDQEECINCGICADICPEHAISMEEVTTIDDQRCTGCGLCMDECPNQAIGLIPLKDVLLS